jgi:hypothetical protein
MPSANGGGGGDGTGTLFFFFNRIWYQALDTTF